MLFRRSAATTRAHQEEAIRRRVSGRNSLWSERHKSYRKKAGQANSRDSQISVEWLFGARCRNAVPAGVQRGRVPLSGQGWNALPSDMMLCVISYWVLSGALQAADLQLRCIVSPAPAHRFLCTASERRDNRWNWHDTTDAPESTVLTIQSIMTAVLKLPTASISTRNVSSRTSIGIATTASALLCSPRVRKVWPTLLKKSKSSITNCITPTSPKSRMSATPKSGTRNETAQQKIC